MRYYRINFGGADTDDGRGNADAVPDVHARVTDFWLEDEAGRRIDNVEQGQTIGLNVVIEARRELARPIFAVHILNADGATVFGIDTRLIEGGQPDRIAAGERIRLAGRLENPLLPGRYLANCFVFREGERRGALQTMHLPGFIVFGTHSGPGIVSVKGDVKLIPEPRDVHE